MSNNNNFKQIGKKIYFEKSSGNVILDTGERSGDVIETTVEQDFATYVALANRNPESVGFIELAYGQFVDDFNQCVGYHINTATNGIEFSYPTPSSSTPVESVYKKPIIQEIDDLKSQNAQIILSLVTHDLM